MGLFVDRVASEPELKEVVVQSIPAAADAADTAKRARHVHKVPRDDAIAPSTAHCLFPSAVAVRNSKDQPRCLQLFKNADRILELKGGRSISQGYVSGRRAP